MSAWIENDTDLPLAGVRKVTRWALGQIGVNLRLVEVQVAHTDHWHHTGRFCLTTMGRHGQLIGARILADVPRQFNGQLYDRGLRGGPPPIDPHSWEEALVCILAHEGTHLVQWLRGPTTNGYTRIVRGEQRQVGGHIFSEVEAEWAEYRLLNLWRERRKT